MATKLGGSIARRISIRGTPDELEVTLSDDGELRLSRIVPGKRRRDNEQDTVLNVHDLRSEEQPKDSDRAAAALRRILSRLAVSDFGSDAKTCGYKAKVRVIELFKESFGLQYVEKPADLECLDCP